MADNLQLSRISKRVRAIQDFTVPEVPRLPEWFVRQFKLEDYNAEFERWRQNVQTQLREGFSAVQQLNDLILFGTGSPEGKVSASPGKIYLNLSGGASTTLWTKENGNDETGWIAK